MRASIETQLTLLEWAEYYGISPWEMAQFEIPENNQCDTVVFQHTWQTPQFLSREEVARAIAAAENMIATKLTFWPAPKFVEETVEWPRARPLQWVGYAPAVPLSLNWRKIQGGGSMARTVIAATVNVTRSDPDSDNYDELFTATTPAGSLTDASEIAVYFIDADRLGEDLDETWRIRPVRVTISGGTITIKGHSALLCKPAKTTAINPEPLSPTDAANYVTQIAVYRVYRDATATEENMLQGWALWDEWPGADCDSTPCYQTARPVCIAEQFAEGGQVRINFADSTCWDWRTPNRAHLKYISGVPRQPNGRMDRQYAEIVARLSAALLTADKCGCDPAQNLLHYWRSLPGDGEEDRPTTAEEILMPFGPRRGAVFAWKQVRDLRILGGVTA